MGASTADWMRLANDGSLGFLGSSKGFDETPGFMVNLRNLLRERVTTAFSIFVWPCVSAL